MATTLPPPSPASTEPVEAIQTLTAPTLHASEEYVPERAMTMSQVTQPVEDHQSYEEFLSVLGLGLWTLAGMFVALGVIGVIILGSAVAMSGLFVLGAGGFALGYWARSRASNR